MRRENTMFLDLANTGNYMLDVYNRSIMYRAFLVPLSQNKISQQTSQALCHLLFKWEKRSWPLDHSNWWLFCCLCRWLLTLVGCFPEAYDGLWAQVSRALRRRLLKTLVKKYLPNERHCSTAQPSTVSIRPRGSVGRKVVFAMAEQERDDFQWQDSRTLSLASPSTHTAGMLGRANGDVAATHDALHLRSALCDQRASCAPMTLSFEFSSVFALLEPNQDWGLILSALGKPRQYLPQFYLQSK